MSKSIFMLLVTGFLVHAPTRYLLSMDVSAPDYENCYTVHTDSMITIEDFWRELQKTETMLVQTSRSIFRERAGRIFEGVNLERADLILLLRMSFGLNTDGFTVDDYHVRYPYSSRELIADQLQSLADSGYVSRKDTLPEFRLTEKGLTLVNHYMNETGTMIQTLEIDGITKGEVETLIEMDHNILDALVDNMGEHNSPILKNRLGGIQPDYSEKQLWHHWQIIWSILAALEDEQEYFRKRNNIDPFAWYIRRNLWFISQRPWLGGPQTTEGFVGYFNSYAPVKDAEEKIENTTRRMRAAGWLETEGDTLKLTREGLQDHEEDERQVMERFFNRWPELSQDEIEEVYTIVSRLNDTLEQMKRAAES